MPGRRELLCESRETGAPRGRGKTPRAGSRAVCACGWSSGAQERGLRERLAGLRPRRPPGRRRLAPTAEGRGCVPLHRDTLGEEGQSIGFREAQAPRAPVRVRAPRSAPARAQLWEENVVVFRVPATCRTSPTPRISCLRALTLPRKALNCARVVGLCLLVVIFG